MPRKPTRGTSYAVGYGKPPAETQFKPGISGNPKGRPKANLRMDTTLESELRKTVVVTESGKAKKLSKFQLIIRQMIHRALAGDARATLALLRLLNTHDIAPSEEPILEITADLPALPATLRTPGEPVEMVTRTSRYYIQEEDFERVYGRKRNGR